jgi:hypothetical protein
MDAIAYINSFYSDFLKEYENIEREKSLVEQEGFSELHYNTVSPSSNIIYPSNKNFYYKRDDYHTEQNKFMGIELYTKENNTIKFFKIVNRNPILNIMFPEKDNINIKYTENNLKAYFNNFCSKYEFLTDFGYVSPSSNNNIRFESKKINLVIMDTNIENNSLTFKIKDQLYNLNKKFEAMYFLSDEKIEINNPLYEKAFVYGVRFEFNDYKQLLSTSGKIS